MKAQHVAIVVYWVMAIVMILRTTFLRSQDEMREIFSHTGMPYSKGSHVAIIVLAGLLWPLMLVLDIVDGIKKVTK